MFSCGRCSSASAQGQAGSRDLMLWRLKPAEIRRAMKGRARFDAGIQERVGHTENRGHHCFGSLIPEVAVVFDDAAINLYVPVGDVHISNLLYLPNIELSFRTVSSEAVAHMVML